MPNPQESPKTKAQQDFQNFMHQVEARQSQSSFIPWVAAILSIPVIVGASYALFRITSG